MGKGRHHVYQIRIMLDPIPVEDGGFKVGSQISESSFHEGLDRQTFSVGTIFKIDGKQKIIREEGGKYKLELMP